MRTLPLALAAAALVATPIVAFGAEDPPVVPPPESSPMPGPLLDPPTPLVVEPPGDALPAPAAARLHHGPLPAGCRPAMLPAREAWVERTVVIPEKTREECVPVYETVKVPTFEERRVPEYPDVQVPVHATREVPCFEDRQVPRYGPVEVPVYAEVRKPVGFSIPNPFDCEDGCLDVHLWDTCEQVVCGTEVKTDVVGFDTHRVQVGTQTETYVAGFESRRELVGERVETVQVGERDEQRLVGYRNEVHVIEPARTEIVRECVRIPAERVTVVAAADVAKTPALPGTTRVLTEEDFRREIASAR